MGDSDDEYDRKRRDKFRGERGAGGEVYRPERRDDRRPGLSGSSGGRDDWVDRNPFRGSGSGGRPRPEYRDYRTPRDRYSSPGRDLQPVKRMRPDWGDDIRNSIPRYGYDPYLMHAWNEHYAQSLHTAYSHSGGASGSHGSHAREPIISGEMQTQPPMMTLKQFLDTQDDGISDAEVLRKYSEYKLEFKRLQLNEFFVAHKDEEWFKNKYHPIDSVNRREEQLSFLRRRVEVFNELLENGKIKSVTVDTSQTEPLLRLLDTVVIKLEGGTNDDLKILDEIPKEPIQFSERIFQRSNQDNDDDVIITSIENKPSLLRKNRIEVAKVVSPPPKRRLATSDDEENWDDGENDLNIKEKDDESVKNNMDILDDAEVDDRRDNKLKRKRMDSDSSSSSSNDSDSSSSSSSEHYDNDETRDKYNVEDVKVEANEVENLKESIAIENPEKEDRLKENDDQDGNEVIETNIPKLDTIGENEQAIASSESMETGNTAIISKKNSTDDQIPHEKEETDDISPIIAEAINENKQEVEADAETTNEKGTAHENNNDQDLSPTKITANDKASSFDVEKEKEGPQPRPLHRTSSIFLRNLAPTITKAEIEAICKNYEGYLRVAIADPLVERRWYRRGWVTFKRDVNIKEICWNLNNTRLRDCEMGAIVNRDLSRRVRPVNGMTAHKTIVRSDIKLCAKIALNMDEKFKLWEENENEADKLTSNGVNSSKSYGFDSNNPVLQNITDYLIEEASAEEEELLGISRENKDTEGEVIERDPQLVSVLDSLILYLRIVHSIDFYNHCEYPYEDEMPNRCGIIHARGPTPTRISQNDIQEYMKSFETKMQQFLVKASTVDEEELKSLGCKDTDAEVEKFIQANSQELAKDKWLCPLSGKKFKGPEFIRKHIFNKHAEKIEEVRKEVEYFNNYLRDPKRPQLPEHPGASKRSNSESSGGGNAGPHIYPPPYPPPYAYAPPMMMPTRGGRSFSGGRREIPMEHQRRIIGYHDLDAPSNFDIFD